MDDRGDFGASPLGSLIVMLQGTQVHVPTLPQFRSLEELHALFDEGSIPQSKISPRSISSRAPQPRTHNGFGAKCPQVATAQQLEVLMKQLPSHPVSPPKVRHKPKGGLASRTSGRSDVQPSDEGGDFLCHYWRHAWPDYTRCNTITTSQSSQS